MTVINVYRPDDVLDLIDEAKSTRDFLRKNGANPDSKDWFQYQMLDQSLRPFDKRVFVQVDFDDIDESDRLDAYFDGISHRDPRVGMEVVADDGKGTRCKATIEEVRDTEKIAIIKVDRDSFGIEELFLSVEGYGPPSY